jgi:hypothetical protein
MGWDMVLRIALVACLLLSCGGPTGMEVRMKIEKALEKHTNRLMAVDGVEGVGIGGTAQAPVIVIMVRSGATRMARALPDKIEGYPVKVETSGEISAQ